MGEVWVFLPLNENLTKIIFFYFIEYIEVEFIKNIN